MELKPAEAEVVDENLSYYAPLIGDRRTGQAFGGRVRSIIGAESLVCARLAGHSPELAASSNGEQRIRCDDVFLVHVVGRFGRCGLGDEGRHIAELLRRGARNRCVEESGSPPTARSRRVASVLPTLMPRTWESSSSTRAMSASRARLSSAQMGVQASG